MEKWNEIFKGSIPVGKYLASVANGDELGLIVQLKNDSNIINIDFGAVSVLRMLDEGIVLQDLFEPNAFDELWEKKFPNTIYLLENSELSRFTNKICSELYEDFKLKHYVIITLNYVIEVITRWEPTIEVLGIE